MFGYSAAEAVGSPASLIIPPEEMEQASSVHERVKQGESVAPFEAVRQTRDGRRSVMSYWLMPESALDDPDEAAALAAMALAAARRTKAAQGRKGGRTAKGRAARKKKVPEPVT